MLATQTENLTETDASRILGISHKSIRTWVRRRYLLSSGTTFDIAWKVIKTYRISDVLACAEKFRDQEIPDGHITTIEAARRLRVHQSTVKSWVQKGRFKHVDVMRNGKIVKYIPASAVDSATATKTPSQHTAISARSDATYIHDALDTCPIMYGLLTAYDVDVLERRRTRFMERKGVKV